MRKGENLHQIPSPSAPITPNPAPEAAKPWLFVLDHASQSNPEALSLFEKMLGALKLSVQDVQTTFASDSESVDAALKSYAGYKVCILMGDSLSASISTNIFTTHSPAECLANAAFKRPIWDVLQQAQATL